MLKEDGSTSTCASLTNFSPMDLLKENLDVTTALQWEAPAPKSAETALLNERNRKLADELGIIMSSSTNVESKLYRRDGNKSKQRFGASNFSGKDSKFQNSPRLSPLKRDHKGVSKGVGNREMVSNPSGNLNDKFRWSPKKKLSRQAMERIRYLHEHDPKRFTIRELSASYRIGYESVKRIIRSKFIPDEERSKEMDRKRELERLRWRKTVAKQMQSAGTHRPVEK
jgi:hypothetical protein